MTDMSGLPSLHVPPTASTPLSSPAQSEGYIGKFRTLNGEIRQVERIQPQQTKTGIIEAIKKVWNWFLTFLDSWKNSKITTTAEQRSFLFETHMSAEHMGQGELAGNSSGFAIDAAVATLMKMEEALPRSLLNSIRFASDISYELLHIPIKEKKQQRTATPQISTDFPTVQFPPALLTDILQPNAPNTVAEKIKSLVVNEGTALPVLTRKHAMLMYVKRIEDKDGKKQFQIALHNTGDGIKYHHSKPDGKRTLYQMAYEINDISEEQLCQGDFLKKLFACKDMEHEKGMKHIYEKLLPSLGKGADARTDDSRFWGHEQIGGSCTSSCIKSFIRSQLDPITYKQFRDLGKMEKLLHSWEQLKRGSEPYPATHKLVTLEVVNQLERSLKKRKIDLPPELIEMRSQLKEMILSETTNPLSLGLAVQTGITASSEKNERSTPHTFSLNEIPVTTYLVDQDKIASDSVADNLNIAFTLLTKGVPEESLTAALPYIKKASDLWKGPCTGKEFRKILKIFSKIQAYCEDRPLTLEQIKGMYELSSTLSLLVSRQSRQKNSEVSEFAKEMEYLYDQLNIESKLPPETDSGSSFL
jgi:hypothetical protein